MAENQINNIGSLFSVSNLISVITTLVAAYIVLLVKSIKKDFQSGDNLIDQKVEAYIKEGEKKWKKFDEVEKLVNKVDKSLGSVDTSIDAIKESLEAGNKKFERIDRRLDKIVNGKE